MSRAAKLACYLIPGLVGLITFVVFSPALRNGFVNWDDFETIVENQNFRGLTWSHLALDVYDFPPGSLSTVKLAYL